MYFQDTSKQYQPLFTTKQSSQDCHQYKKNNLWYLWYLCDKFMKRLFDIVAIELGCRTILCKRRLADGDAIALKITLTANPNENKNSRFWISRGGYCFSEGTFAETACGRYCGQGSGNSRPPPICLRRKWELAPLCGAGVTFSGSSKDPSRPLYGEVFRRPCNW